MISISITNKKKNTKAEDGIPLIRKAFITKENYHFTTNILIQKSDLTAEVLKIF